MIHSGLNLGLKYKSSQTTVNKAQVDNESLHLSSEKYLKVNEYTKYTWGVWIFHFKDHVVIKSSSSQ